MTHSTSRITSLLSLLVLCAGAPAALGQHEYDVVWDSPSADASGSMPLGNGEIGVNAWVEESGDLLFYVARTDSWGDNGRLLKVGRVRIALDPAPRMKGSAFRQALRLSDATMETRFGEGEAATVVRLWVDAHHPLVHVTVQGPGAGAVTATLEPWRTAPLELPSIECSDIMLDRGKPQDMHAPTIVYPDTVLAGEENRIGWYHHNARSIGPELTARLQGLADFARPDPLLDRTFGGILTGDGVQRLDDLHLLSRPAKEHHLRLYVHTTHPGGPARWREEIDGIITATEAQRPAALRAAHEKTWAEFWQQSWIHVTPVGDATGPQPIPANEHPVRLGIDQGGVNAFPGELGRIGLFGEVASDEDVARMAATTSGSKLPPRATVLYAGVPAAPLALDGSATWDLSAGLTVEAWVRLDSSPGRGGRIVDKVTPGVDDGFLLDTHPGNGLRLITAAGVLQATDALTPGKWTHVAGVVDPRAGELRLYVDGALIQDQSFESLGDTFVVSRAYALQRFLDAAAGSGSYPIKFNGSIFTVPHPGAPGDADYRRWGPGYWWQNTRLPYLSMCTSGDTALMRPLFRMYAQELMPLFVHRTRKYFGHGGAFIPECIYFWGDCFTETYGWTPFEERGEDKLQSSGWHKWEWVSGLELVWMMLDYYEHTLDDAFLADDLLPTAHEILTFFDQHYDRDADGQLVMHPAQALETWWDCTDPMPEVAGLHAVTARLLALPPASTNEAQRAFWNQLAAALPPVPVREVDGVSMLAPAGRFANKSNVENPELYAVFPFRLVSFEKENAALGRAALDHRSDRGNFGWRQDDLFMAYLGLADDARHNLVGRARNSHPGSRFPAFWGPNYDWVPDQDHGGVLMRALQVMLLQTEGRTIHLLPAWPADWNVKFRLHAPHQTVIEGEVRDGALHGLKVTPPSRAADVVVHDAQ